MAVQQDDIKRILAYSTLSQLGYMVMAVGLGSPDAAMFHLTTHASFKALLFLGAGSVIVALHHEQDIWRMGGLRERMPKTYWTFLIGTMALCGVPLFSGFFSKEAILDVALENSILLFFVAVFVALLTTFYMTRLFVVAFMGEPRSAQAEHAKESPAVMTVPLLVLAVPSVIAGYFNAHAVNPLVLAASLVVCGVRHARGQHRCTAEPRPIRSRPRFGRLTKALRNRFWFDEIYQWLIDQCAGELGQAGGRHRPLGDRRVAGARRTWHDRVGRARVAPGPDRQPANVRLLVRGRHGCAFGFHVELIHEMDWLLIIVLLPLLAAAAVGFVPGSQRRMIRGITIWAHPACRCFAR